MALLVATGATKAAAAGKVSLTDCTLPGLADRARCGELAVPENPDRPGGRQLTLSIAIVPATGGKAEADPIVPLMGGPGEDAISAAAAFTARFAPLLEDRDLLLVDQRGTGQSSRLRCTLHDPRAPAPNLQHLFPPEAVAACVRDLSRRADLTQYTYLHFARDLEAVRQALGYGKLNLSAGSYGTRAAQVFVRAYPESVRTMYLGSVVPIDVATPLTMAQASQALFTSTFDACATDADCHAAYPDLRQELDDVLMRLESRAVTAPLSRGRVVEWLRAQLYRPGTAAAVPWLVHQAHSGNWSPIVEGIVLQAGGFDSAYGAGLFFSITCAEDMAFMSEAEIPAASTGTFLGDYRVRQQQAACAQWPKASLPAGYRDLVRTSVPTMFVSGDRDGASPLWFTERVAPGFTRRVEIVARGQGHTEWSPCIGRLYEQFVRSGDVAGIDPAICPSVPQPPFKLLQPAKDLTPHGVKAPARHPL